MVEELIEKFSFNAKKYIGGFMGFAFGYVFITHGFSSTMVVMLTTLLGWILGDKQNIKKLKRILINRLKEE
jgi:chromate transport protein ChrA